MYTELVGNFEAASTSDLQAITLNSNAALRAEALGLIPSPTADSIVDIYACSCCGSGCNCSHSNTSGNVSTRAEIPAADTILAAALAA